MSYTIFRNPNHQFIVFAITEKLKCYYRRSDKTVFVKDITQQENLDYYGEVLQCSDDEIEKLLSTAEEINPISLCSPVYTGSKDLPFQSMLICPTSEDQGVVEAIYHLLIKGVEVGYLNENTYFKFPFPNTYLNLKYPDKVYVSYSRESGYVPFEYDHPVSRLGFKSMILDKEGNEIPFPDKFYSLSDLVEVELDTPIVKIENSEKNQIELHYGLEEIQESETCKCYKFDKQKLNKAIPEIVKNFDYISFSEVSFIDSMKRFKTIFIIYSFFSEMNFEWKFENTKLKLANHRNKSIMIPFGTRLLCREFFTSSEASNLLIDRNFDNEIVDMENASMYGINSVKSFFISKNKRVLENFLSNFEFTHDKNKNNFKIHSSCKMPEAKDKYESLKGGNLHYDFLLVSNKTDEEKVRFLEYAISSFRVSAREFEYIFLNTNFDNNTDFFKKKLYDKLFYRVKNSKDRSSYFSLHLINNGFFEIDEEERLKEVQQYIKDIAVFCYFPDYYEMVMKCKSNSYLLSDDMKIISSKNDEKIKNLLLSCEEVIVEDYFACLKDKKKYAETVLSRIDISHKFETYLNSLI